MRQRIFGRSSQSLSDGCRMGHMVYFGNPYSISQDEKHEWDYGPTERKRKHPNMQRLHKHVMIGSVTILVSRQLSNGIS